MFNKACANYRLLGIEEKMKKLEKERENKIKWFQNYRHARKATLPENINIIRIGSFSVNVLTKINPNRNDSMFGKKCQQKKLEEKKHQQSF